jgi:hypothetical protein
MRFSVAASGSLCTDATQPTPSPIGAASKTVTHLIRVIHLETMHETKGFQEWKQLVDCYMICLLDGESLGLSSLANHLFVLVMYIFTTA